MDEKYFESQINRRRRADQEMYEDAFADLLSIVGIKGKKAIRETKGAVSEILRHFGMEVPDVPENIHDLNSQLEYMLRPSNTMRRRVELFGQWWKDSVGALLASTKDGQIVAIIQNEWTGKYEYKDKNGHTIAINKTTAKNLNTDAFCFYKTFPQKKLKIKDLALFMLSIIPKADFALMLAIGLSMMLLGMITGPYIQYVIIRVLIPSGSSSLLLSFGSFFFGITLGSALIGITQSVVSNKFQSRLGLQLNSAIMIRFFSLPTKFFKNYTAGELASRTGYIAQLCNMIIGAIIGPGINMLFSLGYVFQMVSFAPSLVPFGIIMIVVNIGFTALMTFYRQSINRKMMKIQPKLQSLTYALFGGIQKIKVAGAEKRAFAKWAEQYAEVEKYSYSPPMLIRLSGLVSLLISSLGTMALYYLTITTKVPLENFNAFNAAYGMVSAAIMSLSTTALQFANLGPILDMVKPVLEEEPESTSGRKIPTSLSGDIEISNLSFKYTEEGPWIVDNLTFRIKKGEYLALVGKTGCGKSTLMRLLLGFETPQQGAIYYGGKDLATLDLRSVRQKIGVVMQNGSLFPGDIFSNIIVTAPWKVMDDAWEAARLAGIEEDIKNMPMGMHTLIAEGAGGISGGQKQRLMIARAIINRPPILFFDEATSALDNITQQHVAESIASLKSTRVVIAHRLSTIKHCDRILVLSEGKIKEEGTYEELMKKKGEFYEMAIRQVAEIKETEGVKF